MWRELEKLERDMTDRQRKTRYHPEAPSSMQGTESRDPFVQSDLPAFRLTVKHIFPTENMYAAYSRKSAVFPYCFVKA